MKLKKPHILPLPQGLTTKDPAVLIATWFGCGRIRPAPGTIGSLGAIPVGMMIMWLGGAWALLIAAVIALYAGAWATGKYSAASATKDDQTIVIDEVVGLWIAAIPAALSPVLWLIAFLLFRLFDVTKPWPASYFDRKDTKWAVMLDDVIAGFYAFLGTAATAMAMGI